MVHWDGHRDLMSAREQGGLGICRRREQQDPRPAAAELRLKRRGEPAPESTYLHARPDMKSDRNHPLGKEKTPVCDSAITMRHSLAHMIDDGSPRNG